MSLKEDVLKLKKEKNAIILAHYYVDGAVQDVADFVGDSYALAKKAKNTDADIIVFAGVKFMGESAKMLNPDKKVLMPDLNADCPMAHMASKAVIKKMKEEYEDLAVVCYINSTAELKTMADICVTSSNAVKIVRSLPNKNIFFIPDGNLGAYVKKQVPEKNIILNDGYCITHKRVTLKDVEKAREEHPNVPIIVHPECVNEVVEATDFAGSTSELIQYTVDNPSKEFVIGTELGVLHEMQLKSPDKTFYPSVEEAAEAGNKRAQLASDMLNYQIKKTIGSYIAAMGGVDAIVFTGGIGEHDAIARAKICHHMDWLGIRIDTEKNKHPVGDVCEITAWGAKVRTLVIATDEELMIARDTKEVIEEK